MRSEAMEAAKRICKSIDALTREIYLLRKDLRTEIETSINLGLEEEPTEVYWADGTRIPPLPPTGTFRPALLAGGKHFQL